MGLIIYFKILKMPELVLSMKMEIQIPAGANGTVTKILKHEGSAVTAGQPLMVIKEDE